MSYLKPVWRVAIFFACVSLPLVLQGQVTQESLLPLPQDANQFVKETIKYQTEADAADHTHWRYHIHREDDKGSQDRDVIDTKDGQLARTLLINGQPLTAEQRVADQARMKKLVEDPGERAKRAKRAKQGKRATAASPTAANPPSQTAVPISIATASRTAPKLCCKTRASARTSRTGRRSLA